MFNVKSIDETKILIKEYFSSFQLTEKIVKVEESFGYVIAKDIHSKENVPHYNRSTVDGYACISTSIQLASEQSEIPLTFIGESKMGEECLFEVDDTSCVYVPTGGHLPKNADCMVMIEDTNTLGSQVLIGKPSSKWNNVLLKGSDIEQGEVVFLQYTKINDRVIGTLKSLGINEVVVYERLKVAIISTGDELTLNSELKIGEIRDINTFTISNYIKDYCDIKKQVIIKDDFEQYKNAIYQGFEECDLVLSSGGSSVGDKDYTAAIMKELGADVFVHGINIKPGKPTVLARYKKKAFIGLPGQPTSAYVVLNVIFKEFYDAIYHQTKKPQDP